jgi:hypothetical protein
MKKVVIGLMVLILLTGFYAGVNKLRYVQHMYGGISVGGGSTRYTANDPNEVIDSIRVIGGQAYIYSGGDTIPVYIPVANYDDIYDYVPKLIPDTVQKTSNFTLALTDANKDLMCVKATSIVITIPANGTVAIPIGTTLNFYGEGAGIMVFKAAANVHLHSDKDSIATSRQHQVVGLKKRGANYWVLYGSLTD